MVLDLLEAARGRGVVDHSDGERPFVGDGESEVLVFLVQGGGNEGFEDEPSPEVDTVQIMLVIDIAEMVGEKQERRVQWLNTTLKTTLHIFGAD